MTLPLQVPAPPCVGSFIVDAVLWPLFVARAVLLAFASMPMPR